jgi:hypothetical protein
VRDYLSTVAFAIQRPAATRIANAMSGSFVHADGNAPTLPAKRAFP